MLSIDPVWALAVLLVWARLGALLTLSPLAQTVKASPAFWVLFTLMLSGALCTGLGLRAPRAAGLGDLLLMLLMEVSLGALLGLSLHAAFATLAMAGRLLDVQMGFGMAAMLDPVTRANVPVMGVALTLAGLSAFFGVEGHHVLLRGVVAIAQWVPPGAPWGLPDSAALARMMGVMFSMTIVLAAPAMFLLLLTELVLDCASRVLPQMNVLFISMPIKALLGLTALVIAAPGMAPALHRLYRSVFDFWQVVQP